MQALKKEEIEERLKKSIPYWQFKDGFISRQYRTSGWPETLLLVNTIGHFCQAGWHHPELEVSYSLVAVKFVTHDIGGVTEKDFMIASKLEETLMWRPVWQEAPGNIGGTDNSVPPYILYD